ncbi:hypothetical protein [Sphingomonas sp.]|uniref:hypothetical protein n=1 Tax=Sphingomonas sp. TaxID=28214 RepID=UPI002EDBB84B
MDLLIRDFKMIIRKISLYDAHPAKAFAQPCYRAIACAVIHDRGSLCAIPIEGDIEKSVDPDVVIYRSSSVDIKQISIEMGMNVNNIGNLDEELWENIEISVEKTHVDFSGLLAYSDLMHDSSRINDKNNYCIITTHAGLIEIFTDRKIITR